MIMTSATQSDQDASHHVPSLPIELTDAIIDCLADHRRALKACTLVCRVWSPRAQAHLFRRMNWTVDFDIRRARDPVATFVSSPVRAYVQHMNVYFTLVSPLWNLGVVECFLSLFTRTQSLDLSGTHLFVRVPHVLVRALAAAFPGLRELRLGSALMFNYASDLAELVCAFRDLRSFTWEGVVQPMDRDAQDRLAIEPLEKLEVLSSSRSSELPVTVYDNILGLDGYARLSSLKVDDPDLNYLNSALAQGPLPLLTRLSLCVNRDSNISLDLSNCSSLVSLNLSTFELGVPFGIRWAASTLSTIPTACPLQKLELNIGIDSIDSTTLRPLRSVPIFKRLAVLTLFVTFREENDWVDLQPHQLLQAEDEFLAFFAVINEKLKVEIEDGCPDMNS